MAIAGDPEHPANFGRLCSKGTALGETVGLEGRLLRPRDRTGARRPGRRRSTWSPDGSRARSPTTGPDSVAFYVSGQLLTEDYYVANKLMKGFIGSANIDTNSRLCMASTVAGHKRAFGADMVPGSYDDLEEADLVVLVGSNPAWCHPVLYPAASAAAKAARPAMKVVPIDPRRTETAEDADLHLALAPDSDVALLNGAARRDRPARARSTRPTSRAHVAGFDAALAARPRPPIRGATGLAAADLAAFFDLWVGTAKVVTVFSQGVNQSASGTDKVNAIINCHLATGRIGKPGHRAVLDHRPAQRHGRARGRRARHHARRAHGLRGPGAPRPGRRFWAAPALAEKPGLKAVDLFRACGRGGSRRSGSWRPTRPSRCPTPTACARRSPACPFVVVSDCIAETDTTRLAHVQLPALGWGEKDGTVTNSERRITRQRPFLAAPGEARPDWWIVAEVGRRLGLADAFAYASPAEIFREHAGLSASPHGAGRDFDLAALGRRRLRRAGAGAVAGRRRRALLRRRPLLDPRRQGRGWSRSPRAAARRARPRWPLTLNTGRVRDQWHTMTRTGLRPRLGQHTAEPFVEIHPADAAARGIAPADLVEVTSRAGAVLVRALVTDRVPPGAVFVPMHWSGAFAACGPGRRAGPRRDRPALRAARPQGRPGRGPPLGRRLARLRRLPPPPGAGHRLLGGRPAPASAGAPSSPAPPAPTTGRRSSGRLRRPRRRGGRGRGPRPRHRPRRPGRGGPASPPPSSPPASPSRPPAPMSSPPSRPGRAGAARRPPRRGAGGPRRHRLRLLRRRAPTPSPAPARTAARPASRRSARCSGPAPTAAPAGRSSGRSSPPTSRSSPPSDPRALWTFTRTSSSRRCARSKV